MKSTTSRAADVYRQNHDTPPGEPPVSVLARAMVGTDNREILPINFSALGAGAQTIQTDTATVVVLTEEWDSHNRFASNKFTPAQVGTYDLKGSVDWDAFPSGGGVTQIAIYKNGNVEKVLAHFEGAEDFKLTLAGSCQVRCTVLTDYFELRAYQDNGAPFDIAATATFFQGQYVGPLK